jgi:prepilin-type N-terminal cleavage/methylation domain-containing protein
VLISDRQPRQKQYGFTLIELVITIVLLGIIAGILAPFIAQSMTAFQDEDRTNDIYSRMRYVSEVLTEEEIEALADYYAAYLPEEEE